LGHFLLCAEDLELQLVVLDRILKATTRKGRQKCTPWQNPGYAYEAESAELMKTEKLIDSFASANARKKKFSNDSSE